ncbi:Pyruvate dehydrogenase E2 component (Dihydrolipoamide acetyltransferase) OS=Castellaniella defragrans OX=75697 GN=HNR28_001617 PE=4 SV=1 [Castellaniella defragrans]
MLKTLPRSKTPSGTAYIACGRGGETTVLIHGVGMRIEAWGPQIDFIAQGHRAVAVDLPGHGESRPLDGSPSLGEFVAWFDHFLDEMSLDSVNVIGHSMGALIASGIVAAAPKKVRRVALFNGVYRRTPAASEAVQKRAGEIGSGRFDPFSPLKRWFRADEVKSEAYQTVHDLLALVDPNGYAAAYRAFAAGDRLYSDCWPDVHCPALFLTGSEDHNSTAVMAKAMAAAAPKGTAVVISGHRHMVNLTAPEVVNQAITRWLTSH